MLGPGVECAEGPSLVLPSEPCGGWSGTQRAHLGCSWAAGFGRPRLPAGFIQESRRAQVSPSPPPHVRRGSVAEVGTKGAAGGRARGGEARLGSRSGFWLRGRSAVFKPRVLIIRQRWTFQLLRLRSVTWDHPHEGAGRSRWGGGLCHRARQVQVGAWRRDGLSMLLTVGCLIGARPRTAPT